MPTLESKKTAKFKNLYTFNGSKYVKIRESTSIAYIKELMDSITQSKSTVQILNDINSMLLEETKTLMVGISSTQDVEDIVAVRNNITAILDTIKEVFKLAKDAPNWIETLTDLERRIVKDAEEAELLYGGKPKAFREDPDSISDKGKPSEIKIND
jgi:hypothetical protein